MSGKQDWAASVERAVAAELTAELARQIRLGRFATQTDFEHAVQARRRMSGGSAGRYLRADTTLNISFLYEMCAVLKVSLSAIVARAEVTIGVTTQTTDASTRSEAAHTGTARLPGEVAAKLDELSDRLRPTKETGSTGAGSTRRS